MARYINIDDIVIAYSGHTLDDEFSQGVTFVLEKLESMDFERTMPPVRGKWMKQSNPWLADWSYCSRCMTGTRTRYRDEMGFVETMFYKYCPHCGSYNEEE